MENGIKHSNMSKEQNAVFGAISFPSLTWERGCLVETPIAQVQLRSEIEFHGTNWDAEADVDIAVGEMVEIVGKDSITLKVKSLK